MLTIRCVSIFALTTIIDTPAGIASTRVSLVFLICSRIVKTFLKAMEKKKLNTERLLYWQEISYIV